MKALYIFHFLVIPVFSLFAQSPEKIFHYYFPSERLRLKYLRKIFRETDPSQELNENFEQVFGSNMKTVVEKGLIRLDAIYDFYFPRTKSFLKRTELSGISGNMR